MAADNIRLAVINPRQPIHLVISAGGGGDVPWYAGPTEITPTAAEQTLATSGLRMPSDVTIHPIPSDWGHIIYSGTKIRVE